MDKILSINTIKNVFAALGAKTTDANYAVALLDKTTAEPKGLMGMSDLASVLGVGIGHGGALTRSANDIFVTSSFFVYGDNTLDTPTAYGTLITFCCNINGTYGPSVVQQFFDSSEDKLFTRVATSEVWGTWHER